VQDGSHFGNGSSVVVGHFVNSRVDIGPTLALAAHDDAPVRQLVHWSDGQPATPVKELALLVGYLLP